MHKSQDSGFVLIVVLLVLSVMSLLTLEQYQNLLLQEKIHHSHQSQFRQRQQLLLAAKRLVAYPAIQQARCRIQGHNKSQDILAQLDSPFACQTMIEQHRIRYVIESMGQEPCVHIQANFATQHYQLWLKVQSSTLLLRVHYAISTTVRQCDTHPPRHITPGIQSWNISSAG